MNNLAMQYFNKKKKIDLKHPLYKEITQTFVSVCFPLETQLNEKPLVIQCTSVMSDFHVRFFVYAVLSALVG